jgi:hypothetical protein
MQLFVVICRAHAADPPASYIEADPDISKALVGEFMRCAIHAE